MRTRHSKDLIPHLCFPLKSPQTEDGRETNKEASSFAIGGTIWAYERGPLLVLLKAISLRVLNAPGEQIYSLWDTK